MRIVETVINDVNKSKIPFNHSKMNEVKIGNLDPNKRN